MNMKIDESAIESWGTALAEWVLSALEQTGISRGAALGIMRDQLLRDFPALRTLKHVPEGDAYWDKTRSVPIGLVYEIDTHITRLNTVPAPDGTDRYVVCNHTLYPFHDDK